MCKLKKLRNLLKMMKKIKLLKRVHQKKISVEKAYGILYDPIYKLPKAHFLKVRIHLNKKGWGLNMLLGIIFALPVGIWFVRWILKKTYKKQGSMQLSLDEIMSFIEAKGISLSVMNDEVNMRIKSF